MRVIDQPEPARESESEMEKEKQMEPTVNRRKYPRHLALFSAKYIVKSGTFRDLIGNVSAGGIYIHTRRDIARGQRITLRFPIIAFDQRPSVVGTVVRSQDQGFAVMFDRPIEERIPTDGLGVSGQRG